MDIPARPVRPRNSESSPSQRFLGNFAPRNPSPASPTDELSEDDIFSTVDFSDDGHHHHQRSSPQPPPPRHVNHHHHHYNHHYHQHSRLRNSVFSPTETFGILAVLPEHEPRSVFNHQASASAASPPATASSSRMIPAIPRRPPQDRFPIASSSSYSARHNQSAPVNVPTLSKAMTVRRRKEFVEVEEEVEEEEEADKDLDGEEMLPPHEIVERRLSRSQSVACSLLEGAGRTLKGRDLRQVRNAVWRKTGFLD